MDDSRQWRLRAELCRKVAGQMGDHWAADCLRSMADEYLAHAVDLETDTHPETHARGQSPDAHFAIRPSWKHSH